MRYSKQIKLDGFGKEAQEKLAKARVLVIGAGGLGCPALTYLAAAGLGHIGIVDHDIIEESNLPRQPLYATNDIGKAKVLVATEKLKNQNPEIEIITWQSKLSPSNALDIISGFDLVLDCTDNFEARYLINDACVILNKPWIYGAVEAWEGQVAVFNTIHKNGSKTATYRCIFPEPDLEALSCDDLGVIGTMPGTVGVLQANEAIKFITQTGKVIEGLLLMNLYTNSFQTIRIQRNEEAVSTIKTLRKNYGFVLEQTPDQISIEEFKLNPSEYFIIDIREPHEIKDQPFTMADMHIPMNQLLHQNGFDFQQWTKYLLVCAKGIRSLNTAQKLSEMHPDIHFFSLEGGVLEYFS